MRYKSIEAARLDRWTTVAMLAKGASMVRISVGLTEWSMFQALDKSFLMFAGSRPVTFEELAAEVRAALPPAGDDLEKWGSFFVTAAYKALVVDAPTDEQPFKRENRGFPHAPRPMDLMSAAVSALPVFVKVTLGTDRTIVLKDARGSRVGWDSLPWMSVGDTYKESADMVLPVKTCSDMLMAAYAGLVPVDQFRAMEVYSAVAAGSKVADELSVTIGGISVPEVKE